MTLILSGTDSSVSAPAVQGGTGGTTTGLYYPATNQVALATNGSQALLVDSSQNVGIGVTPSAWATLLPLQVKNGYVAGYLNRVYVGANNYYDGSNSRYIATDYATRYYQYAGQHVWENAASGTAGNAITFTQAMTLGANGNLLIGSTTAPTGFARLSLVGGESSGTGANSGVQFTYNSSTYGGGAITTVNAAGGGMSFYTFTGNVGSETYTERARIDSSGNINLKTSNAGIIFNNSSASVNSTLNDYETGSWTPVVSRSGSSPTVSYSSRAGTYTKVGNIVTVFWDVQISSISGGSGVPLLSGLPFTVSSGMAGYSVVMHRDATALNSGNFAGSQIKGFAQIGATYLYMQQDNSGTSGYASGADPAWVANRTTGYCTYQASF